MKESYILFNIVIYNIIQIKSTSLNKKMDVSLGRIGFSSFIHFDMVVSTVIEDTFNNLLLKKQTLINDRFKLVHLESLHLFVNLSTFRDNI